MHRSNVSLTRGSGLYGMWDRLLRPDANRPDQLGPFVNVVSDEFPQFDGRACKGRIAAQVGETRLHFELAVQAPKRCRRSSFAMREAAIGPLPPTACIAPCPQLEKADATSLTRGGS